MTFLLSLVFHAPKPIKLGSKGSSTRSWGLNIPKNQKTEKKIKN
jgi:hypothetical protein